MRLLPNGSHSSIGERSSLDGWSGIWRIGLATIPALLVGYFVGHRIKEELFNPAVVSGALAVGGVAILLIERFAARRTSDQIDHLTLGQALGVGLFQVLALWPGTSRAAATIIGGMVVGLNRKSAAEFSFLIAVPVMFAATGYELFEMRDRLAIHDSQEFVIGFLVSFIVALAAVKGFIRYLGRGKLAPFAWYRILAAPIFYLLTRGLSF